MPSSPDQEPEVNTQGPDISPCFTTDPENTKIPFLIIFDQFTLINGPDTELTLHCGDQGWTLKEGPCESFNGPIELFGIINCGMEAYHSDIFFTSRLLCLD